MLATLIGSPATAQAQTNYQLDPTGASQGVQPLDLGGGGTLYICERKFGWDSTHVALLNTAPDHTLNGASAFRGHSWVTFLNDADPLGTGYALCGSQSSAGLSYAFITHLTGTFATDWSRSIDGINGVGFFQDQIAAVIPSGSSFTAYTKRGGMLASGSYRLFGEESGATWNGQAMTAPAGVLYNVSGAIASATDEHTLYGAGAFDPTNWDRSLMLMRTDLTGATWMKFYDMLASSSTSQAEETFSLIPTSDGNFLLAAYFSTGASTFEGCLLKLAGDGSVLWCRRYADASGGLTLKTVVELPGGGLMVAGEDAFYHAMVLDLQADGTLVGARRYQIAGDVVQRFHINSLGGLKLLTQDKVITFNSASESCDFVAVSTVTSMPHTPTITTHVMTNAPFTPTTTVLSTPVRTNDLSWTPTCVVNGVQEPGPVAGSLVHPVPTARTAHIAGLHADERVIVRDIAGAVRFDGGYGDGVDMRDWPAGAYFCEVPRVGWRLRLVRE